MNKVKVKFDFWIISILNSHHVCKSYKKMDEILILDK